MAHAGMIERVAKAIRDAECGPDSREPHETYIETAYAAITVMRDELRGSPAANWATMLDAALGQQAVKEV